MEDSNNDILDYNDISADLEAHRGAKYTGGSASLLNGGGRRSYENYPMYLINSIEAELAHRQNQQYDSTNKTGWHYKGRKQSTAKRPYESTEIKAKETVEAIFKLLKAHGAQNIEFGASGWVLFQIKSGSKTLTIRKLKPNVENPDVAMRYLYWNIKTSCEAVVSGMETEENIWLMDTVIPLGNNKYTTIGEASKKAFLSLPSGV